MERPSGDNPAQATRSALDERLIRLRWAYRALARKLDGKRVFVRPPTPGSGEYGSILQEIEALSEALLNEGRPQSSAPLGHRTFRRLAEIVATDTRLLAGTYMGGRCVPVLPHRASGRQAVPAAVEPYQSRWIGVSDIFFQRLLGEWFRRLGPAGAGGHDLGIPDLADEIARLGHPQSASGGGGGDLTEHHERLIRNVRAALARRHLILGCVAAALRPTERTGPPSPSDAGSPPSPLSPFRGPGERHAALESFGEWSRWLLETRQGVEHPDGRRIIALTLLACCDGMVATFGEIRNAQDAPDDAVQEGRRAIADTMANLADCAYPSADAEMDGPGWAASEWAPAASRLSEATPISFDCSKVDPDSLPLWVLLSAGAQSSLVQGRGAATAEIFFDAARWVRCHPETPSNDVVRRMAEWIVGWVNRGALEPVVSDSALATGQAASVSGATAVNVGEYDPRRAFTDLVSEHLRIPTCAALDSLGCTFWFGASKAIQRRQETAERRGYHLVLLWRYVSHHPSIREAEPGAALALLVALQGLHLLKESSAESGDGTGRAGDAEADPHVFTWLLGMEALADARSVFGGRGDGLGPVVEGLSSSYESVLRSAQGSAPHPGCPMARIARYWLDGESLRPEMSEKEGSESGPVASDGAKSDSAPRVAYEVLAGDVERLRRAWHAGTRTRHLHEDQLPVLREFAATIEPGTPPRGPGGRDPAGIAHWHRASADIGLSRKVRARAFRRMGEVLLRAVRSETDVFDGEARTRLAWASYHYSMQAARLSREAGRLHSTAWALVSAGNALLSVPYRPGNWVVDQAGAYQDAIRLLRGDEYPETYRVRAGVYGAVTRWIRIRQKEVDRRGREVVQSYGQLIRDLDDVEVPYAPSARHRKPARHIHDVDPTPDGADFLALRHALRKYAILGRDRLDPPEPPSDNVTAGHQSRDHSAWFRKVASVRRDFRSCPPRPRPDGHATDRSFDVFSGRFERIRAAFASMIGPTAGVPTPGEIERIATETYRDPIRATRWHTLALTPFPRGDLLADAACELRSPLIGCWAVARLVGCEASLTRSRRCPKGTFRRRREVLSLLRWIETSLRPSGDGGEGDRGGSADQSESLPGLADVLRSAAVEFGARTLAELALLLGTNAHGHPMKAGRPSGTPIVPPYDLLVWADRCLEVSIDRPRAEGSAGSGHGGSRRSAWGSAAGLDNLRPVTELIAHDASAERRTRSAAERLYLTVYHVDGLAPGAPGRAPPSQWNRDPLWEAFIQ